MAYTFTEKTGETGSSLFGGLVNDANHNALTGATGAGPQTSDATGTGTSNLRPHWMNQSGTDEVIMTSYGSSGSMVQTGSFTTSGTGSTAVSFPTAFGAAPKVVLTPIASGGTVIPNLESTPSTTGFTAGGFSVSGSRVNGFVVHWIAIGG